MFQRHRTSVVDEPRVESMQRTKKKLDETVSLSVQKESALRAPVPLLSRPGPRPRPTSTPWTRSRGRNLVHRGGRDLVHALGRDPWSPFPHRTLALKEGTATAAAPPSGTRQRPPPETAPLSLGRGGRRPLRSPDEAALPHSPYRAVSAHPFCFLPRRGGGAGPRGAPFRAESSPFHWQSTSKEMARTTVGVPRNDAAAC